MRPAIGVFHDWCLINFFYSYLQAHSSVRGEALMRRHYGKSAWEIYCSSSSEDFLTNAATHFPMTDICRARRGSSADIGSDYTTSVTESRASGTS